MLDDVVMNRVETIERCLERIRWEAAQAPHPLFEQTREDAIVLNLVRACEASIDLAMHVVKLERLGLPQSAADSFDLLLEKRYIDGALHQHLRDMVSFRNTAVHEYQKIKPEVLKRVLQERLVDFEALCRAIVGKR